MTKFIVLALIVAGLFTFISSVARRIGHHLHYPIQSSYYEYRLEDFRSNAGPQIEHEEEPLFFEREIETGYDRQQNYRVISVH